MNSIQRLGKTKLKTLGGYFSPVVVLLGLQVAGGVAISGCIGTGGAASRSGESSVGADTGLLLPAEDSSIYGGSRCNFQIQRCCPEKRRVYTVGVEASSALGHDRDTISIRFKYVDRAAVYTNRVVLIKASV